MLELIGRSQAAYASSLHPRGFQLFLAFSLALGGLAGSLRGGSSDSNYGQIPLTFVANHGQVHHSVRFTAKGPGMTAYFTLDEVVVDLRGAAVRMRYLGANVSPGLDGLDPQEGRVNYLIGNDPGQWKTDIPLYGRVAYKNLYPGIDMVYSSHTRLLKSEFVVAPGADPSHIQIAYTGVKSLRLDDRGGLVFTIANGELREDAPEIYQEAGGARVPVEGAFRISGEVVSFHVGQYDRSRPLRIDPVLSYSTYLGGAGTDKANAIAVDGNGSAYVTGYTDSTDFPVSGGVVRPVSGGGVDAFVTKLNSTGSAIVYSTYLGGNGDDRGFSIAVDGSGNAYVTGWTGSTDFPLTAAAQGVLGGGRDAFVSKLNSSGTALLYSTYLGGSGADSGNGIAIDAGGAAYVTGSTTSSNFPVAGAYQGTLGGQQDGFVTKLNAAGSAIVYSTYLGGALDDRGSSIAVDSSGAAYIAGNTSSTNFPTYLALQPANSGATDAFVTKLNPSGVTLAYSTYLGGSGTENVEVGRSIVVDSSGSAYITGGTSSANFPVLGPLQAAGGGGNDAFVVKLSPAGSAFVYSTYLGGSGIDYGQSIALDSSARAHVTGYTSSIDFPTVSADQPANGGGYDVFIAKLNASGSALVESGYLGGSGSDTGFGIALDLSGNAYVAGQTLSSNFPLKGPIQTGNSTLAAFVAKYTFGPTGPPTAVSISPASGSGSNQTFTLMFADSRGFADIAWVEMNWNATQSTVNACYLHYNRSSNVLQLSTDAGAGWIGSATLGASGILQNSQCSVDAGASSASGSGNNLSLNLALTFKAAFTGSKTDYMQVQDVSSTLAPWQARGSWTVATVPLASVSVSPASGTGAAQVFTFVYSDPAGYADISYVDFLFQSTLSAGNACYAVYVRSSNVITLFNDAGTGVAGSGNAGTAGTLSNSQCSLNTFSSSASGSGTTLTLTIALTFQPAFGGTRNTYMVVGNNGNVSSGWQVMGNWTVTGPPAAVSLTPASGSGAAQVFTFVYSDPIGYADISYVDFLFQSTLSAGNACYAVYVRSSNVISLFNDAGTGVTGSGTPGTAGTLTNSQCTLNVGSSSITASGTTLTLTIALAFQPGFSGTKNTYMVVGNNSNVSSGWQVMGNWTVSGPPATVSVTPASGTGTAQVFTFVYSDPAGFADISYVDVLFQSGLFGQNACYVVYLRAANSINLFNDAATAYAGSATLGAAAMLTNSQCTLNSGASSISVSGNNLTLALALTFNPGFNGAKNIYMVAGNNSGLSSGWQTKGVWTPQ